MNITREYFSMVDYAAGNLIEFVDEVFKDESLFANARKEYPNIVREKDINSLNTVLIFDILRCYERLGHDFELDTGTGLGLFMVAIRSRFEYELLDEAFSIGVDAVKSMVAETAGQLYIIPDDFGFLFEKIFPVGDDSLRKRFRVLLYRFCSVVAKADGTIDPDESKYLSELMSMTGSGGDVAAGTAKREDKAAKYFDGNISKAKSAAMDELDELIGLDTVKQDIHTLANFAKVQQMRKEKGLKTTPLSLHCVFSGNPGTGKTTVARYLGKIYHELGLSKTGELVETDRSGLVAEYVGQTAVKTNKVIDSALGGVLFIDEAYTLASASKEDYGKEAIATLLKRMEDDRDRLVVILAGYTDKMEEFLQSNPGLNSRFGRRIFFEDYSLDELVEIFLLNVRKFDYVITDEAKAALRDKISLTLENKPDDFGNARYVRNIFEQVLQIQANRVAVLPAVTTELLSTIEKEDIERL